MRHLIVSSSDSKYGDFVCEHWLGSLRANVDLRDVDVAVLDYGMTPAQVQCLTDQGVICYPSVKDGHITNIRYRDLALLLKERPPYDQVLSTDGGDLIFQTDLRHLFDEHKDKFRGVYEHLSIQLHPGIFGTSDFRPGMVKEILAFLGDRSPANGGFILGPAPKFIELWDEFERVCHGHGIHGNDQLIVNYFMQRTGFVPLEERYNCVLLTTRRRFRVKDGVFLDARTGQPLAVVHNVGMNKYFRSVRNFGFGPAHNQVRRLWLTVVPLYHHFQSIWVKVRQDVRQG